MSDQAKPVRNESPIEGDLDLIYKIEGERSDVDVFELSRVLDAFGNVLKESYRVAYPKEGELSVKIKPFQQGSFLMDITLNVQHTPGYLFLAAHPEMIQQAKQVLEYLGFIKKAKDVGGSLLELLRRLKNGKPEKVEQKGPDEYVYHAEDGAVMPVNSTVHALYNNPVINHYTFNIVAPAERESVESILTYLKADPENTRVKIGKEDASAVRAFAEPTENQSQDRDVGKYDNEGSKSQVRQLRANNGNMEFHDCRNAPSDQGTD